MGIIERTSRTDISIKRHSITQIKFVDCVGCTCTQSWKERWWISCSQATVTHVCSPLFCDQRAANFAHVEHLNSRHTLKIHKTQTITNYACPWRNCEISEKGHRVACVPLLVFVVSADGCCGVLTTQTRCGNSTLTRGTAFPPTGSVDGKDGSPRAWPRSWTT